jgi:arabinogalactan oligomer/maltooligosaccharide transport system permease protein
MERSTKAGRVMTHAFLIIFTAGVLFPVAKVIQVAFQDRQTFDMSLVPVPDAELLSVENFSYVVGRSKVEGLGPEISEEDVEVLSSFLATIPQEKAGDGDGDGDDDDDEDEWEVPETMANRMQERGCFACHMLGEHGRPGLGGDLRNVAALGKEKIHSFLSSPTGAMERWTVWLFGRQLLNSLIVALCTTILGIFLATTAAYAFSRFRFPGRRAGLLSFLVIQMFPGTMMMIPLYILVSSLGLLDQLLGLILVYSTTAIPFCVWMLKGYFDTIPKELEESAIIDGASRFRIFWSIILPLAKPAIAVTGLFSFMTAWNEFILAATFMNDETAHTLPVMLNGFVSATTVEWGHFAAGAIIVSIPVVALFFLLQRHLVSGLTAGGVKG